MCSFKSVAVCGKEETNDSMQPRQEIDSRTLQMQTSCALAKASVKFSKSGCSYKEQEWEINTTCLTVITLSVPKKSTAVWTERPCDGINRWYASEDIQHLNICYNFTTTKSDNLPRPFFLQVPWAKVGILVFAEQTQHNQKSGGKVEGNVLC